MTKLRIAVVNSHPIQYFAPLYAFLNAQPDLEVTALYLSDISIRGGTDKGFGREVKWDLDLLAGYKHKFVGKDAGNRVPSGFWSLVVPELWNEIRGDRYDVLWLFGHQFAANFVALAAAKTRRLPVLMRGETHLLLHRGRSRRSLRRPAMNSFYRVCDRFLAIGTANHAFYRAMGVPPERIFMAPYSIDNARFTAASRLDAAERAIVRGRYDIPVGEPAILYAAKFTVRKHPEHLLQAAERLRHMTNRPHTIVMAGAGAMEAELRDFCQNQGLTNVKFCGFVNQTELPELYGASDVFVLPSENEPWGLTINEAMCAGLPIVTTNEVGCVPDLVADGINGVTYRTGDIGALAEGLKCLIENDELRRRQSTASLARISRWGYPEVLRGLRAALHSLGLDIGVHPLLESATASAGRNRPG